MLLIMIYEFKKNSYEKIRITESDFNGSSLYHIRTYLRSKDGNGEDLWLPTKKGVSMDRHAIPDLLKGIAALEEHVYGKSKSL